MTETTVPATTERDTDVASTREDSRFLVPPVDIYEIQDTLVVLVDMPGVGKDAVSVDVEDGILTISGRTDYSIRGEAVIEEFGLLNFYRQFQLNEQVDQEKIEAELKNGVLTVKLPKAEKAKPRQIQVKVS